MIDTETVRRLALSFPDAEEQPHFELASFRVKKKIFATLNEKEKLAMLKLPLIEQSVFCAMDKEAFYPVPGGWGTKGATYVNLENANLEMFADGMRVAYENLAKPKKI